MLSITGWLDGITASGVVIFGIVFGLYFIYHSKKVKAKLLYYVGVLVILAGLAFLGVFLDFLNVIITGKNLDNSFGIIGLLSYVWIAPLIVIGIYIGAELMTPKRKGLLTGIYIVLMCIFEILLFLDPFGSFDFTYPNKSGEELIDYNLNLGSPAGMLMIIFILSMFGFLGIGFLIKAFQATGEIRKKFLLLSLGVFLYCIFGLFESLIVPGYALIIIRIGYISGPLFMFKALKE